MGNNKEHPQTGPKRSRDQRKMDKLAIAKFRKKGYNYHTIRDMLNESNEYTLSHVQIWRDHQETIAEVIDKTHNIVELERKKAIATAHYWREQAVESFEISKSPTVKTKIEKDDSGNVIKVVEEIIPNDAGNPSFITAGNSNESNLAKLLGLNAPEEIKDVTEDAIDYSKLSDETIKAIKADLERENDEAKS